MFIMFLLIWVITALGLWVVTETVQGVRTDNSGSLWVAALVLGLINATLRPLLWFFTMPLTVLTLGLFAIVVNAFTIWLAAQFVDGFEVRNFGSALMAALIMALLGIAGLLVIQWIMFGQFSWMIAHSGPPM